MNKRLTILVLITFSLLSYGQVTTFQKNINYKARILNQEFNQDKDSLTLTSDTVISQVDIFNDDYMKSMNVNENEAKIDLGTLPLGEYIVQARLGKKRIIMYVTREEPTPLKLEVTEPKLNSKLNATTSKKSPKIRYWVVYENNTTSYYKFMGFKDEASLSKMIDRNKLELSTEIGKNNKLAIYEVYDTLQFIRRQKKNPEYINSTSSEFFNTTPYYSSSNLNSSIE